MMSDEPLFPIMFFSACVWGVVVNVSPSATVGYRGTEGHTGGRELQNGKHLWQGMWIRTKKLPNQIKMLNMLNMKPDLGHSLGPVPNFEIS